MSRLIDADELIKWIEDRYEITWETDTYEGGIKDACSDMLKKIDNMPTIEPERKKGRWTDNNACPFCGFQPWYGRDIHTLSYCPNCGADMRGEGNEINRR